jgi:hypothetical protein
MEGSESITLQIITDPDPGGKKTYGFGSGHFYDAEIFGSSPLRSIFLVNNFEVATGVR